MTLESVLGPPPQHFLSEDKFLGYWESQQFRFPDRMTPGFHIVRGTDQPPFRRDPLLLTEIALLHYDADGKLDAFYRFDNDPAKAGRNRQLAMIRQDRRRLHHGVELYQTFWRFRHEHLGHPEPGELEGQEFTKAGWELAIVALRGVIERGS